MAPENPEPSVYTFSPRELQRLAIYRAAVVAGFYNEQCDAFPTLRQFASAKPASLRRNMN